MSAKFPKHKHELKEDKFVTAAFLTSEFVVQHWKKLLILAIIILVIIFVIIAINANRKRVDSQALSQFDIAMSYYSNNDFEKSEEEFTILSENYSSSKYHDWAFFYLGKINIEKDSVDYNKAEQCFRKAASKLHNKIIKEAAMIGIAKCYFGQNDIENYYAYLDEITKKFPDSFNTPEHIYEIAEHYFEKNDKVIAQKYYHKIVERYKTSSVFQKAKRRLGEIKEVE